MVDLPILSQRYQLNQRIGRGGMAFVYSAWDTYLKREVAVKILKPILLKDKNNHLRFRQEVMIHGMLQHPNIMPIYDHGVVDDLPYLVMPLIKGQSLKQYLLSGLLPVLLSLDIFFQVCEAIGYAHSIGIAHGDIKPANILITPPNQVTLTDFGVAAITGFPPTSQTWGSIHYAAPEQTAGSPPTFRSDVYSLGILLFLLLTGNLPSKPDPINTYTIPNVFQQIIKKALCNDPAKRYTDAREMYTAGKNASSKLFALENHLRIESDPF